MALDNTDNCKVTEAPTLVIGGGKTRPVGTGISNNYYITLLVKDGMPKDGSISDWKDFTGCKYTQRYCSVYAQRQCVCTAALRTVAVCVHSGIAHSSSVCAQRHCAQ